MTLLSAAEEMALHSQATRIVGATRLRDAVQAFNAAPISQSSVETLRDRVLAIADFLAPPSELDMDAAKDAELASRVGLLRLVEDPQ